MASLVYAEAHSYISAEWVLQAIGPNGRFLRRPNYVWAKEVRPWKRDRDRDRQTDRQADRDRDKVILYYTRIKI